MNKIKLIAGIFLFILASCGNTKTEEGKETKDNKEKESDKEEIANEEEAMQKETGWSGNYSDGINNAMIIEGPLEDGTVSFTITQASETCEGSMIAGDAFLTAENVANYDGEDDCHLTFTYNNGEIEVKETNCDDYHGATCGMFNGKYKREE